MIERNNPWAGRLLNLEPHDSTLREKYESQLNDHFGSRLSPALRARYVAVGLAGLVGCVVCGSLAITEPESLPGAVRGLLILFAFFGLSWTLFATLVLVRGPENFADRRGMSARMAFGFTLISVVALSFVSSLSGRSAVGTPMAITGLALLILAAVIVVDARIERSESLIREQILRVESRLIELARSVEPARGDGGGKGEG